MAANVIDSLVITLGLDAARLEAALQKAADAVERFAALAAQFGQGLNEGMNRGADGAEDLAGKAEDAGDALVDAGKKGGAALDGIVKKSGEAHFGMRRIEAQAKRMGRRLGASIRGFLASVAAPVMGVVAAGSLIKGYFGDLAELDELYKKTSLTMEEQAKKQQLLGRYSEEDLARYRKSQAALESLKSAFIRAFAPVMQVIVPALGWLARWLEKALRFIQQHKAFVIPFVTMLALLIGKLLIPAIRAVGLAAKKAMLPFWPFIAIITLLALLIEDLWVYTQGGESALDDLWSLFGTGEEIAENLAIAWKYLKMIGSALFAGLKTAIKGTIALVRSLVGPFVKIFRSVFGIIRARLTGDLSGVRKHYENLGKDIREFFVKLFTGTGNLIIHTITNYFDAMGVNIKATILDAIEFVKKKIREVWEEVKGYLGKAAEFLGLGSGTVDSSSGGYASGYFSGPNAWMLAASPAQAGTTNNISETTTTVGGIYVTAQSSDAAGIARETAKQVRNTANLSNRGPK